MTRVVCHPKKSHNLFDNLFDELFAAPMVFGPQHRPASVSPKVNIREAAENVTLTFELPGLDKGDINVAVAGDLLTVSGERKVDTEVKSDDYLRREIRSGKFERSFTLPEYVDATKINADYKNGLLVVSLPKTEETKPRKIEVSIT